MTVGGAACPREEPVASMDLAVVAAVPVVKPFQAKHCSAAEHLVGPPVDFLHCLQIESTLSKASTLTLLKWNAVVSIDTEYQALTTALHNKFRLRHLIKSLHKVLAHCRR